MSSVLTQIKKTILHVILLTGIASCTHEQEYISPTQPVETGKAPGVKIKLLSINGQTKNYVLIFAKGDEIRSGLTEFTLKYNVPTAHFSAIGDATSVKLVFLNTTAKRLSSCRLANHLKYRL